MGMKLVKFTKKLVNHSLSLETVIEEQLHLVTETQACIHMYVKFLAPKLKSDWLIAGLYICMKFVK